MKRMLRTILAVLVISTMMSASISADTKYVNSEDGLRIRNKPDEDAEVLAVIPFGEEVRLLDDWDHRGWYRIEYENDVAYISAEYTQDTDPLDDMVYMGEWRITAYAYTGRLTVSTGGSLHLTTGTTMAIRNAPSTML